MRQRERPRARHQLKVLVDVARLYRHDEVTCLVNEIDVHPRPRKPIRIVRNLRWIEASQDASGAVTLENSQCPVGAEGLWRANEQLGAADAALGSRRGAVNLTVHGHDR
jgi:hypothetical protein